MPDQPAVDKKMRQKIEQYGANLNKEYESHQKISDNDVLNSHRLHVCQFALEFYNERNTLSPVLLSFDEDGDETATMSWGLKWEDCRDLGERGGWINENIIEYITMTSPSINPEVDFLPINSKFYQNFLGQAGSSQKIEAAIKDPGDYHRPQIKDTATKLVVPWCVAGMHWVVFTAEVRGDNRTITLFDSKGEYKPTMGSLHLIPLIMDLVGVFHPRFSGPWNVEIQHGETLLQRRDDCGVATAYACRSLLAGHEPLVPANSDAFLQHLRTLYLGKIRAALEGQPSDTYYALAGEHDDEVPYQESHFDGDFEYGDLDSYQGEHCNGDCESSDFSIHADADSAASDCLAEEGCASDPEADTDREAIDFLPTADEDDKYIFKTMKARKFSSSDIVAATVAEKPVAWLELRHGMRKHRPRLEGALHASLSFAPKTKLSISNLRTKTGFKLSPSPWVGRERKIGLATIGHLVSKECEALWASEQHIKTNADDIENSYSLVVVIQRDSGALQSWQNGLDKHQARADQVYNAWDSIHNQHRRPHQYIGTGAEITSNDNCYRTIWRMDVGSSNLPLMIGNKARSKDTERVCEIIKGIAKPHRGMKESKEDPKKKILILMAGIDAATTDNSS